MRQPPHWALQFGFHVNISLEYGPFEELNKSNRIRLCGFLKMILPVWTLKSVNSPFGMEYDQRVIIKFLLNEGADVRDIADRLQEQFGEYIYKVQTVQFWIAEVRLGRQYLYDEIRIGKSPLDDFDAKILAILDKSHFESARSIAETLRVAHPIMLLYLHNSIGFKSFHLHWAPASVDA
jgi:hypothetical protein